jgi:deoxyribose-phosphate aldolase
MRLADFIEHTLLRAEATATEVEHHCRAAIESGLLAVCISPVNVPSARRWVGERAVVVSVAGFPLGTSAQAVKAEEARRAVEEGAAEVDMVLAIGHALAGAWAQVEADIRRVRDAIPASVLKVILETGYFDEPGLRRAVEAAIAAGADFLKTSTGFGPRGATEEDVRILREAARGRAQVKASGGIRSPAQARAMIAAGASRIGTSNGVVIARSGLSG